MEIDGHPTTDIIDELERRGAVRMNGTSTGPDPDALRFLGERFQDAPGFWVFLPLEAFNTGIDELPV